MSSGQLNNAMDAVRDLLEKLRRQNEPIEEQLGKALDGDAEIITFREMDMWPDDFFDLPEEDWL